MFRPELQSLTKVLILLQYLSEKLIISPPSPRLSVIYRDVAGIARFQDCRGGGLPILVVSYFSRNSSSTQFGAS